MRSGPCSDFFLDWYEDTLEFGLVYLQLLPPPWEHPVSFGVETLVGLERRDVDERMYLVILNKFSKSQPQNTVVFLNRYKKTQVFL